MGAQFGWGGVSKQGVYAVFGRFQQGVPVYHFGQDDGLLVAVGFWVIIQVIR